MNAANNDVIINVKRSYEEEHAYMRELVTGKFRNDEVPGGALSFLYRIPFRGELIERYTFTDGEVKPVPRAVALHLEKSGFVPLYEMRPNKDGLNEIVQTGQKKRYNFFNLAALSNSW